jgi:hypothetical protein
MGVITVHVSANVLLAKIKQRRRVVSAIAVALVLAVGGMVALRYSHAATYSQVAEAESGAIAGNASALSGQGASDGMAVKFGGGGSPAASDRPCAASSPWNTRANGQADVHSADYITSGTPGSLKYYFTQNNRGFDIAGTDDYPDYGVPIYAADASTPQVHVNDTYGWWGGTGITVPFPVGAAPAVGTDHHMAVWNKSDNKLYEFWELTKGAGNAWTAGAAATFAADGPCYQTTPWAVSARAYGGSLISGAITLKDIKAGVIDHALGMSYPGTRGQKYAMGLGVDGKTVSIASHSDNYAGAERNTDSNIPEGARFRLKQSVDINARCGSNSACKVIGTALQTYGSYVVDNAAVPTFYAEVLTGKPENWSGLLHTIDAQAFQAEDFELLSLPATLTDARQ